MNQRVQKAYDEIERTKSKIAELQALLPKLERKAMDIENTEIVRAVRSANVAPSDIAAFIESVKSGGRDVSTGQNKVQRKGKQDGAGTANTTDTTSVADTTARADADSGANSGAGTVPGDNEGDAGNDED